MKNIPSTDHLGREYPNWKVMCKSYGISPSLFEKRLYGGMDVRTALTAPSKAPKPCKDHLGREYPSVKAMCEEWHINPTTFRDRLERGLDLETALTAPVSDGPVEDHTGRKFGSEAAMCRFWGVGQKTYRQRLEDGLDKEQALTQPLRDTSVTDHTGRAFPSETAMCEHWGVSYLAYRARITRGKDQKSALTTPVRCTSERHAIDHTGQEFPTATAMCAFWGIGLHTYLRRRKNGMSIEEALTAPMGASPTAQRVTDHKGQEFPSIKAMCEAWNVSQSTYRGRRKRGMSLEEALTGTGRKEQPA